MAENGRDIPFIQLKQITKSFGPVRALKGVSFDLRPGEVHAICGENGAGKSTLIKVMTGAHGYDEGEYFLDGAPMRFKSPLEAIERGISCVYQELTTALQMTVAENLFLGKLPQKHGVLDLRALYQQSEEILHQLGMNISPKQIAGTLSVGQQQMLEIGRALAHEARVIIMDEPTSSLSDAEVDRLFEIIHTLKAKGIAIVYISHKLDEVMYLADRITVIRDGENITTVQKEETNQDALISYMIGRSLESMYHKSPAKIGEVALSVDGLSDPGVFSDISFQVRKGEIVGFFGLVGAGRSEIMRAIFGAEHVKTGTVALNQKSFRAMSPRNSIRNGLGFVTEDRKGDGLMLGLSILLNMTVVRLRSFSRLGLINRRAQKRCAEEYFERLSVKAASLSQPVGDLSGGNQQKVVLAKWLMNEPDVLIVDEPTRGIDIGAKARIYAILDQLAQRGMAIIVVSSEIEEILGVCDRVYTVFEGKITADLPITPELTSEQVLSAALGFGSSGASAWRSPPPRKDLEGIRRDGCEQ